jgi:hypothetical protein
MDDLQLELEDFSKAARGEAEAELARSQRPSFDGVWNAIESRESMELEDGDPELFRWLAAARGTAQADLDAASRRVVPPMKGLQRGDDAPSRRVGVSWWIGWLAAAVLLFFAGDWALRATQMGPEAAHQAEREVEPRDTAGKALERPVMVEEPTPPASLELIPPVEAVELEPSEEASKAEVPTKAAKRKAKPKVSKRERLRELDAQAQALWRAGDLDGAEGLFEEIVAKGGKSSLADVAYGDLLTLARQRGKQAHEIELWRAYLRRFPRGRHADDASAGLCRRMSGASAVTCWQSYLEEFPKGSHRSTAKKVLAVSEGSP